MMTSASALAHTDPNKPLHTHKNASQSVNSQQQRGFWQDVGDNDILQAVGATSASGNVTNNMTNGNTGNISGNGRGMKVT